MKINRGGIQAFQTVCSPGFVFLMVSCSIQKDIYKSQTNDFLNQLMKCSIADVIILLGSLTFAYFYIVNFSKSPYLKEAQTGEFLWRRGDYFSLVEIYLWLVLVNSIIQYFSYKNETTLSWWYFLVSSFVAVFLGFINSWIYVYLIKRRLNSARQTETISH